MTGAFKFAGDMFPQIICKSETGPYTLIVPSIPGCPETIIDFAEIKSGQRIEFEGSEFRIVRVGTDTQARIVPA